MTAPDIRLRPATSDDVPALLALMDTVLEWLVARGRPAQWGTTPFSRIPGFPDRLSGWVASGVVTVAERDGRLVGAMAAAPMVPPRVPSGLVPGGSMFVHTVLSDRGPAGRGVGTALLAEAERLARGQGAPALALDHWAGSPELAQLYDQHGYVQVGEYLDNRNGTPVPTVVRLRPLSAPG
jgi:GNAT superfamily N-acetyltransferase